MRARANFVIFFAGVCCLFSIGIASEASVRTILLNTIYTVAQKENRAIVGVGFWNSFRSLLVAHALADWKFDRKPDCGDSNDAARYWDDIDDPLADFLAVHNLAINQRRLGLFFKKIVSESFLCQGCNVLFAALEVLPGCEHAFCDGCILKHYTSPCLCDACFVNRRNSTCVYKKAHLACPQCNAFMGSDFIYLLKQKPDYGKFMFKNIGRKHRAAEVVQRR